MSSTVNIKLNNVTDAFGTVQSKGTQYKWSCKSNPPNLAESHVQGIAIWNDFVIFVQNNKGYSKGIMQVVDRNSTDCLFTFDTPRDYNHPGGTQLIGDYLAVPFETSDHKKSKIYFYDLNNLLDNPPLLPLLLPCTIIQATEGCGAVCITNYTENETEYYLLIAYNNGTYNFYKSNGKTLNDLDCCFEKLYAVSPPLLEDRDYQGLALITDTEQNIYMIGLRTDDLFGSNKDYMDLYKLDISNPAYPFSTDVVDPRHMTCVHSGAAIPGADGTHFRWGAGGVVSDLNSLILWATQRNFSAGKCYTNSFKK